MRSAVDDAWAVIDPDPDQRSVTSPAGYLFLQLFCDRVAGAYDSWMKGASLLGGDLIAVTPGPSLLSASLRTYQFLGWAPAFTSYLLSVIWVPGLGQTLLTGGGASATVLPKAAALQSALGALVLAGGSAAAFSHRHGFADRIATLLATYTVGTTITSVPRFKPPPTVEAPIT